ncbi:hypothetical protein [Aquimarina megaterium]|uniref:hypothetical protein n=1 Tax=Aquimarina megaterium TaxID=1443666 RepID=UPI0009435D2D|nr:hypothetical protein [Aquimarina megaterium]
MIEVIQTPAINRVLADGNDAVVIVKSLRGPKYYFKIKISVGGELIFEQSWSKDETGTSRYNLKLLYYSYFNNDFSIPNTIGFEYKPNLYQRVRIDIQEVEILTGTVVETTDVPEFFIIKNRRPYPFTDSEDLILLDYDVDQINVPVDGLIIFPLYSNGENPIVVTVHDDQDTELFSQSYNASTTKIMRYNLPLSLLSIGADVRYLKITMTCGAITINKIANIVRESIYPIKQVFHLNNFGMYLCSYLMGKLEEENRLKPKEYIREDGNAITYDVENKIMVDINTGFGYSNKLAQLIAKSIDVRIIVDSVWERMSAKTKKILKYEDNKFIYEDTLKFSKIDTPNFNNNGVFNQIPKATDIVLSGLENESIQFGVSIILEAFQDDGTLQSITFYNPTVNGWFGYTKPNGQFITIFNGNTDNPLLFSPLTINAIDITSFKYTPITERFGSPLDDIEFKLSDGSYSSNSARMKFNISEVIDSRIAPSLNLVTQYTIVVDGSGSGQVLVPITVVNPDGFPTTVTWSENDPKVGLSNTSETSGIISLINSNDEDEFYVMLRVEDTRGLFNEYTVNIKAASKIIDFRVDEKNASASNIRLYEIILSNGIPNGRIDFDFIAVLPGFDQFVSIRDTASPITISMYSGLENESSTITFDNLGKIKLIIEMTDSRQAIPPFDGVNLKVKISNPSSGMFISPSNDTINISP